MALLTLAELNTNCTIVASYKPLYDDVVDEYFRMLLYSGCRPIELFDITRWSFADGYRWAWQPAKGNNIRYIQDGLVPPLFANAILTQTDLFGIYSMAKYNYIFNSFSTYSRLSTDTKDITNYSFRYAFVKNLYANGMPIPDIVTEMGWTNSIMAYGYINAEINGI